MTTESKVLLELTEHEVKQILGTAVKQMFRISTEPDCDMELQTLSSVIKKCSVATKQIHHESHASKITV